MSYMLRTVYKIECTLLSKYDIIVNEISPFTEFYIKIRGIDFQVIDSTIRETIGSELNENELKLHYFDREVFITEKINTKFRDLNQQCVAIHCYCHCHCV